MSGCWRTTRISGSEGYGKDCTRRRRGADGSLRRTIYTGPPRRESDGVDAQLLYDARRGEAHAMLNRIRIETGMEKGDRFDIAFVDSTDESESS